MLKKTLKQSYRRQVFGFETQDVAPIVWERLLQEQQATQAQLNALRDLRAQLLEACQIQGAALQEVGIRTVFDEDKQEEVVYTSDEDEQQLSSEEMQEGQELLKDVAIEAGTWIIAKEAKAAQLLLKAGKLLKLGKKIKKAGKVLIQVTDSKVSKKAKRLVGKEGGRMVKKGGQGAASYKFPDKKELAKRLNIHPDQIHSAKKIILERFKTLLRKKDFKNPDIGIDSLGNIIFKHPVTKKTIVTKVPLSDFGL